MNWLQYAKRQNSTANAAMWQLCRAVYKFLESEEGNPKEMEHALNVTDDTITNYYRAYSLWAALCREDWRLADTYRRKLTFSHFHRLARAIRLYDLSLLEAFAELMNAADQGLSVRDFDAELSATYAEHYVAPWSERARHVVSYFQDLLATPDAPDDFKRDLAALLQRYFYT